MLAIGRGLMAEPKLLILDEPSLGLSPLLVEELFALIKTINAEGHRPPPGRAERGAKPRGGAARLYPRQRRVRARGKRRRHPQRPQSQARLSRDVTMADAETLRSRLTRKPIVVAPASTTPFTALGRRAGGVHHALCLRRRDRLYAARAARHRPRQHERGRRHGGADPRPRRRPSDRRCRHRLRQCAQRRAHGAPVRARRRQRDPARGPGFSQALRPSRRQGADLGGRDVRQDPRRARRPALARDADRSRAPTRSRSKASSARSSAPRAIARPAPTCCSSRRRRTRDELARIGRDARHEACR